LHFLDHCRSLLRRLRGDRCAHGRITSLRVLLTLERIVGLVDVDTDLLDLGRLGSIGQVIQVAIAHLEELVDERAHLLDGDFRGAYEQVCGDHADGDELIQVIALRLIHARDELKHLCEAEVHDLIRLSHERLITNEDLIVAVDVRYAVRQLVLSLRGQIFDHAFVDAHSLHTVQISSPLLQFHQLNESFRDLEEITVRVFRHHDHEAKSCQNILSRHRQELIRVFKVVIESR